MRSGYGHGMQEQEHLPARRPAPQPGQRAQARPSLEAVLAAVPGSRPADPPAPSKHHQIMTLITLVPAVWVVFSPMIVGYPFNATGNTAVAWSQNVGIVVAVAAAARAYQPAVTGRAVVLLAGSVTLVAMAFLGGFRTSAPVVWWDLLLTGSALTVLSLIGLAFLRRERRR